MTSKTIVSLIDDIDGTEATDTVRFALDGTEYEIDLSQANADALRKGLREFIEKARHSTGEIPGKRKRGKTVDVPIGVIRMWAIGRGMNVSRMGRVPVEIVTEYYRLRAAGQLESAKASEPPEPGQAPTGSTVGSTGQEPARDAGGQGARPVPASATAEPPAPEGAAQSQGAGKRGPGRPRGSGGRPRASQSPPAEPEGQGDGHGLTGAQQAVQRAKERVSGARRSGGA